MEQIAIDVAGLEKSYDRKQVLRGVELRVPVGSVVGLMGMNGSGKSTLIKCLLGLVRADAGSSRLLGSDSRDLSVEVKGRLGYVPQVVHQLDWMKVRHLIQYTATFYPNWDDDWVAELVSRWRVPLGDRVNALSTGQLQTLAIVLALGHRPDLMVLDEPVASLDPVARRDFLRSILELARDGNRTVLFSTHISSDLERVATHVAILNAGRIASYSELDELKDRVKRLRVRASDDLPRTLDIPGLLTAKIEGRSALATVSVVTPELVDDLANRYDAEVRVEDLNLEEIFVELNGHG